MNQLSQKVFDLSKENGTLITKNSDNNMKIALLEQEENKLVWYSTSTQKCRFMDKRVREIARFFVAPPRVFPLSVWRVSRTLLSRNTSTLVHDRR